MAAPTLLTANASSTDGTSYTTASISFDSGDLILAYFLGDLVTSGTPAPPSSVTTPSGLTLDLQDELDGDTQFLNYSLYRGEATATGSGTITFNSGGPTWDIGAWAILKVTGHITGSNGASAFNSNKQLSGNKGGGGSDSGSISALAGTHNYCLAAFFGENNNNATVGTATAGNSFTELADTGAAGVGFSEFMTVMTRQNATNPAVTWSLTCTNRSSMVHELLMVDTTAPTLTSPSGTATGSTTAQGQVTTDEGNGTMYAVVSTSSTPPSVAQIQAGNDSTGSAAAWSGNQAISTTGVKTFNATGLTASTAYYFYFQHRDSSTNDSTVSSSAQFTTDAPPAAYVSAWLRA